MKFLTMASALVLMAGCASAAPDAAPAAKSAASDNLRVVQHDARIAQSKASIDTFTTGPGQSVLIKTYGGGLYRVILQPPCRGGDAAYGEGIAVVTDGTDTLDKFSKLLVNGRSCVIASIDRVEEVKPAPS